MSNKCDVPGRDDGRCAATWGANHRLSLFVPPSDAPPDSYGGRRCDFCPGSALVGGDARKALTRLRGSGSDSWRVQ
jgi:hypothetical protein